MNPRHHVNTARGFVALAIAASVFASAPAASAASTQQTAQLECRENASGRVLGDIRIGYRIDTVSATKQQWTVGGYTFDVTDGSALKAARTTISLDTGAGVKTRSVSARPGRPTALLWKVTGPAGVDAAGFSAKMSVGKLRYICRNAA